MENKTIILDGNEYELVPKFKEVMKEKTGIELLKEKYASGDYICCVKNRLGYYKLKVSPFFDMEVDLYKLIHKKDESILKAYLDNPKVEIEVYLTSCAIINYETVKNTWIKCDDFIKSYDYNENCEYRLKEVEKQFEPFDLNIRINTLEEAKSMWNRLSPCDEGLIEGLSKTNSEYFTEVESPEGLGLRWNILNSIINEYDEEQFDRNHFGNNTKEDTKVTNMQDALSKACSELFHLDQQQILVHENLSGDIVSNRGNTYAVCLNFTITTKEDK